MDMKLEVLVLPVSDVDRAKRFYQTMGFRLDIDYAANDTYRVIQFTSPGSGPSIIFGKGITSAAPGSIDRLLLVVYDVEAARQELLAKGIAVGDTFHDARGGLGGGFYLADEGRAPGPDPERRSYGSYAEIRDPDGNRWLLQEIRQRLPGRVSAPAALNGNTAKVLLDALQSTATAHGLHEKELGKPDPDWPRWYASHMAETLGGMGYQLTGAATNG